MSATDTQTDEDRTDADLETLAAIFPMDDVRARTIDDGYTVSLTSGHGCLSDDEMAEALRAGYVVTSVFDNGDDRPAQIVLARLGIER